MIACARAFLDEAAPLAERARTPTPRATPSTDGALVGRRCRTAAGRGLADPGQFVGYRGDAGAPDAILLAHNGLHIEI